MIYRFKTADTFTGINVTLGLLTLARDVRDGALLVKMREPRSYVMGVCDWCSAREIVDEEVNLYNGLGWVTRHSRAQQFCSRKCRAAYVADGELREWRE